MALSAQQGAAYALITGDPGRVPDLARYLDAPMPVAQRREYTTWAGTLDGERVLVSSHGIGGPSTAICVEELAACGVRTLIRVGTCGGMALSVCGGDLVVASAAIRQEGTSQEYLPLAFPAVSDFSVTAALAEAARSAGQRVHVGVVHCKDSFYGQHAPDTMPVRDRLRSQWRAWIAGGCLASEMESAALYTVAAVRGLRAGCILSVLWNQERRAAGLPDEDGGQETEGFVTQHTTADAAAVAVEALRRLLAQDRKEGQAHGF